MRMAKELGEKQEVLRLGNKIGINIWIKKSQDLFSLSRWDDEVMPERIATHTLLSSGGFEIRPHRALAFKMREKTRVQSKRQSESN